MKMMQQFYFKPREVKASCEQERMSHKARIVCFSLAMSLVAGTYNMYFQNVMYRAGQMQAAALGGKIDFVDYTGKHDDEVWELKNRLSVLENKSFRDLKYIMNRGDYRQGTNPSVNSTDWASQSYQWRSQYDIDNNIETEPVYVGPQGNPDVDTLYFTQTERWTDFNVTDWADEQLRTNDPIAYYAAKYDQWETMHDGVIAFDTIPCMGEDVVYIGDANKVNTQPIGTWYRQRTSTTTVPNADNVVTVTYDLY